MKRIGTGVLVLVGGLVSFILVEATDVRIPQRIVVQPVASSCDRVTKTICTMEIWLAHAHKKNKRGIRKVLKDRGIKVLGHTVQYWRPKGGHPPTNIAIGSGLSARDARWVIDFALKYNDGITGLVMQRLNPPNYVAVATSAWDAKSETPVSAQDLERLRDPKLTTEEFHKLYLELTGEEHVAPTFY